MKMLVQPAHQLTLVKGRANLTRHDTLIGRSPALRRVVERIGLVARTDSTVLIQGETGTGKELIARAIHEQSPRRAGPFVALNVAAIPGSLLESEIFGHEKGAFSGALARRIGRFEEAEGGTIFLDEIGELPPEQQPKLLRLLQERELQRLGGSQTIACNVRVIAASNRDLRELAEARLFRADLLYRLDVFPIYSPPLRARLEDIPLLVAHLVERLAGRLGWSPTGVSARTLAQLARYSWPGNIRELQNVIERAMVSWQGGELEVELDEQLAKGQPSPDALSAIVRAHILRVLRDCDWVIAGPKGAAARLGVKRTTLNARLRKLGIARDRQTVTEGAHAWSPARGSHQAIPKEDLP
jgi:transcriptional regulator with GAF, ATPase, and Fis domain